MIRAAVATIVLVTLTAVPVRAADSADPLSGEIQVFLNRYAESYNRQDYRALLDMWDRDAVNPIYMAEEIDPPMHGWNRLNAYFNPRPGIQVLDAIRNEYTDVRATSLAPDLAVATYRLRFDIKVKGMKPMSSWDRVMAVFRRKDGDWKLVAYAEAPMAPLTMVRKMVQNADREGRGSRRNRKALEQVRRLLEEQVPADFEQFISQRQDPVRPPALVAP